MTSDAPRSDVHLSLVAVSAFAVTLGATTVVFPLLALDAGIAPAVVGVLASASAGVQLLLRFALPWLLRRFPDRSLMVTASGLMAASAAVLLWSDALAVFAAAQGLQGAARALFWTANQTHVIRAPGTPVKLLARVQLGSKTGRLVGTAAAGSVVAVSATGALLGAVGAAGVALGASVLLIAHPPYEAARPDEDRTPLWRRPSVGLGSSLAVLAGGWRGMLDSFVPVILAGAGLAAGPIGWIMASSDAAAMAGTGWMARSGVEPIRPVLVRASALAVMGAGMVVPFVADQAIATAAVLAVGGLGFGLTTVFAPVLVNAGVDAEDQGTAIALAGAYRSGIRLVVPAAIGGLAGLVGLTAAMTATAAGMGLPSAMLSSRRTREPAETA